MSGSICFDGFLLFDRPLTPAHRAYLDAFARTRRVRRDPARTAARPDPLRMAIGMPVGEDGGYFVGAGGMLGQEGGGPLFDPGGMSPAELGILDFNAPPAGQPHLWCCWRPTPDGRALHCPDAGAHEGYAAWLGYLIEHFLDWWGYTLSGEVRYNGPAPGESGRIVVTRNLVDLRPDNDAPCPEDELARARALRAASRFDEAIPIYQSFLANLPPSLHRSDQALDGVLGLGLACEGAGRIDDATEHYRQATRLAPWNPSGWTYLGCLLAHRLQRPGEAAPCFEQAIECGSDSAEMWNELGMARGRSGQLRPAAEAFRRAIDEDPDDALPWFNLGHSLLELGDPAEALACFERSAALEDPRCFAPAQDGMIAARRAIASGRG